MKTFLFKLLTLLVIALGIALGTLLMAPYLLAQGPGDLLVTPTRATFEDGKRNEALTLINRGSDTATYQISFVQYRMTTGGELERVEEPDSGQYFASDLVRFFPRMVTIAPGEAQSVRMQLRLPDSLADGEYRSHLYFRSVPKQEALAPAPDTAESSEFSVKLTAVFGVTVPVIVRKGKLSGEVSLGDLALLPGESAEHPLLGLTFRRSGDRSVYGALRVYFRPESGPDVPVGEVAGVAVYTPTGERALRIPLNIPQGLDLYAGRFVAVYETLSDHDPETLATAELAVK